MTVRPLVASVAVIAATLATAAAMPQEPVISVRNTQGAYVVAAHFTVSESAAIVRDVLTDYASIPRFMSNVHTSRILERRDNRVRVEQEATSKFMFFSKRIHLVLDVDEETNTITFRDRCHKSFARYEGAWTFRSTGGLTEVSYELIAEPAFSVPGFVLRGLLDRDAAAMIERLRAEISARASA